MTVLKTRSNLAPLSRLHERQSNDPVDFPVATSREEEGRFTPLRPRPQTAGRYGAARVARVRTADSWMPSCGRRSPALAEEVVGVVAGVCAAYEPTKRVAEVGRLGAGSLASPPAGPDLGPVAPR